MYTGFLFPIPHCIISSDVAHFDLEILLIFSKTQQKASEACVYRKLSVCASKICVGGGLHY